jgi:delta14-sterol reductase
VQTPSKLPPALRDFWYGNEINPTLFGVDLKMFAYHPSLIGLALLVAAFAYRQVEVHGSVSPQMGLYALFWWGYLFTHYLKEEFMLSIYDIIEERFGLMLVWGDLVYVPFFYSITGWWLIDAVEPWPTWALLAVGIFYLLALGLFRSANWQKSRFKKDADAIIWGAPAQTLGGRLLVSGWWGIGRKLNYTGEVGVYVAFTLCAGTASFWPWLLPLSLAALLVHRAGRDDRRCRAKYGELWERYCAQARFRMLPGLY